MDEQQTLSVQGPDGKTYQFPKDATDAEIASFFKTQSEAKPPNWLDKTSEGATIALGLPKQLAPSSKTVLKMLPVAGGVLGGLAGSGVASVPAAGAGAAIGESARRLLSLTTGDETAQEQTPQAVASGAATAALLNAGAAAIPVAAQAVAPVAKGAARGVWNFVAGNSDPAIAENALSRGLGTIRPGNVEALKTASRVGDLAAPVGEKSALWPTYFAMKTAAEKPTSWLDRAIMSGAGYAAGGPVGGAVGAVAAPLGRPAVSAGAQALYSAANQAGPIGQLIRAAILSQLGQK
jgi:hypothetical protein